MVEEAGKVVATPVADQSGQIGDLLSEFTPTEQTPTITESVVATEETPVKEGEEPPIVKEGEEPPVVDEKDKLITTLQTQMAEISAKLEAITGKVEKPPEEAKPVPEFKGDFFESDEEYNNSFEKKDVQNKVLSRVATAAAQQILTGLPKVVSNIVKSQVEVTTKVNSFFADNKDLLAHREFVGFVSNDLQGKNPSWTLDKLFGELGKEVRTRIGLAQATKTPLPGKGGFPPAKGGGARLPGKKTETLTSLEKEIDDLIK